MGFLRSLMVERPSCFTLSNKQYYIDQDWLSLVIISYSSI
ncbi:hypothetical protein VCRA2121O264_540004 [Vibrio crassostreae]|nr:hypothetical protein VCRA2121O264_540004 [Vibrio crassostreae]